MRLIERTPISTADPVPLLDLVDHLRISDTEAASAMRYAKAAAMELEQYTGLALLNQTIVALSDTQPGNTLALPVGPVDADTVPTVELVELDGTLTPVTTGWTLSGGRYPVIRFETEPGGAIQVTYEAGYGPDPSALPVDLCHAILDQALCLYDTRGDVDMRATLVPSAARIAARYRRVSLGAV